MSTEYPERLQPFRFHGIEMRIRGNEAFSDCPQCGASGGSYSVMVETGQYNCFKCQFKGNGSSFLQWLHETSMARTELDEYTPLADERKLLEPSTLRSWGVCKSVTMDEWIVPGYNADGVIVTLYSLRAGEKKGKGVWKVTAGTSHGLYGVNLFDPRCEEMHICEGLWDACAVWELLGKSTTTSHPCILGVPGCAIFREGWPALASNRRVSLLYDNDHPKEHPTSKTEVGLQGFRGMQHATEVLTSHTEPPAAVRYLAWGPNGYNPAFPSGYDLRDHLTTGRHDNSIESRTYLLSQLLDTLRPVPDEWVSRSETKGKGKGKEKTKLTLLPCTKWSVLVNACKKALHWNEGLDRALSVMLAVVMSVQMQEDQLWVKIIGPPSCGKTTLANAILTNTDRTVSIDILRGFHSGMGSRGEDNSLISTLRNKTMITVDGDTLLQAPNRSQILSEARRLYDRDSKAQYRNGVSYDHSNVNIGWLLLGTKSLRVMDESELGERFLDCVVMDTINDEEERQIGMRTAYRVFQNMGNVSNGTAESRDSPEMMKMKQLGGGYAEHLCKNMTKLYAQLNVTENRIIQCQELGYFISYMRAKPTHEDVEREMSPRLVSQICKLAGCLAVVLNRKELDTEVMWRVTRVACDTARGKTLTIASHLYRAGDIGLDVSQVSTLTGNNDTEDRAVLRFMKKIGIVTSQSGKSVTQAAMRNSMFEDTHYGDNPTSAKTRWALTPKMRRLYAAVMKDFKGDVR